MIDLSQLDKIPEPFDQEKAERLQGAIAYLQSTDWQVIAKYERRRPIPDEVKERRKAALDIVTAE